jgi:GDSL-like Lipase/Acylhydrolase
MAVAHIVAFAASTEGDDMETLSGLTLRRLTIGATLGLATVAFLGLSASATPAGGVRTAAPVYPNSIAVIGHSFATGEGVSGRRADWAHNSWVTGDTSAVQSLYSRILARNPGIRGNKFNLARGGADVESMLSQARKAVVIAPAPELVVVQGIDNDITCDSTGHKRFQSAFAEVLDVLATGLPEARIFVVSQFGSMPTYIKALTPKQRINQRTRISASSGPCSFLDARGAPIPKGVAYLEAVIHRYEAAVATACKAVATCRYDGGAFGRVVERPEYISWDVIHLSVQGQAKAAAVAWSALKEVGFIPGSG